MVISPTKNFLKILPALLILFQVGATAQRQMERLDRGLLAVDVGEGGVYVGWRLPGTDPADVVFNVHRNDVKINGEPIIQSTNITVFSDQHNATITPTFLAG